MAVKITTNTGTAGPSRTIGLGPSENTTVRIRVAGEIDSCTAPALQRVLDVQLDRMPTELLVDLHEVTFLGVAGLTVFVRARERALRSGTSLRLLCSTRAVTRPLAMLDLFTIDPGTGVALAQR